MVFSNETRKQTIHQLKHTELDLLIAGNAATDDEQVELGML